MTMTSPSLDAPLGRVPRQIPAPVAVVVADERCKGCGLCVDACPPHALALDGGLVNAMGHHVARLVDPDACTSCARCARVCPDAALTIYTRPKEA
jgi:2-oxoglutarate ferredoxin oxidoreductase subunit delta